MPVKFPSTRASMAESHSPMYEPVSWLPTRLFSGVLAAFGSQSLFALRTRFAQSSPEGSAAPGERVPNSEAVP